MITIIRYNSLILTLRFSALLILVGLIGQSCNEDKFLEEEALDFYAPENSYVTSEDFDAALLTLYSDYRDYMYAQRTPRTYWDISDITLSYYYAQGTRQVNTRLTPSSTEEVLSLWEAFYKLIYDANVIIGRSEDNASQLTEGEKTKVQAEAMFFRGLAYKTLAHLFGGVPLVLEETKSPNRDYVRASRQEVYEQCAQDLAFAAANLDNIDEVYDFEISNLVAYHVLSEVYISLGRWQDAVAAASKVIDNPNTALMTQRFGTRVNDPDFGGDVYWDLFRHGNQNRSSGNRESLWVVQWAYNTPGGGVNRDYSLARNICPVLHSAEITQSDGSTETVLNQPNTYVANRGVGYSGPSPYFRRTVWEKSGFDQDMRNSSHNIVRDVQVMNPANEYNGQWVIADNLPLVKVTEVDTLQRFFPIIMKAVTPGLDPIEFWHQDQSVPGALTAQAGTTYRDHMEIRLAETYLLRAEAHLGNGNTAAAAEDINVVRRRANAPEVSPGEVDIDYILDERMRELYYEEFRLITLMRLGKAVERIKTLNPVVGEHMEDYQDLFPIPISEIQKNTGAVLEQNPGY
ncbi:RagB/SusD family nutrient uptake outer membrane protein [uncultured Kriegella sp.]|uniref:RagB/SusD family nutrient uptake outer membrane protein n=1 Tax=uncultured Kriegella sp. TaxID=1798910 RepID=UPI0030D91E21|tara:strand:+ start:179435 stop:181153 length:1719 start_codon:yes stop_codon:yes gene_type:complete